MPLKSSLTAVLVLFAGALCAAAGNIEYTVTDLGSLAGPTSVATCINNNGWVAGWADDDPVYRYAHAWVWTGSEPLQDLGSFGGLQSVSDVTGLNDNGWAVGQSNLSASSTAATQGFLWTGSGSIQNIGSLGGQNTLPWGINDAGVIVGQSQAADGSYHGFLYSAGVMTDLGSGIAPVAINDSGQIVGQFLVTSGGITTNYSAFISSGGTYTDLGTLGGTATQVWKINGAGAAVGFSDIASGDRHAFIYTDQIQDLGTLGGPESFAYGINSAGLVVGSSDIDSSGDMDAFIWSAAMGMVDLNSLIDPTAGWDLLSANDINDAGEIVGVGVSPSGDEHGFLLVPNSVPEPPALSLLLAGATTFTFTYIRRRRMESEGRISIVNQLSGRDKP